MGEKVIAYVPFLPKVVLFKVVLSKDLPSPKLLFKVFTLNGKLHKKIDKNDVISI